MKKLTFNEAMDLMRGYQNLSGTIEAFVAKDFSLAELWARYADREVKIDILNSTQARIREIIIEDMNTRLMTLATVLDEHGIEVPE